MSLSLSSLINKISYDPVDTLHYLHAYLGVTSEGEFVASGTCDIIQSTMSKYCWIFLREKKEEEATPNEFN